MVYHQAARLLLTRSEWNLSRSLLEEIPEQERDDDAWHQLASIDLNKDGYAAVRDKFTRSLQISHAIGNRAGEATTWNQLGLVAYESGRRDGALRLMAIALLISNTIGDYVGKSIAQNFASLCGMLSMDQAQRDALLEETALDYQKDRGQGLIERTFGGYNPGKFGVAATPTKFSVSGWFQRLRRGRARRRPHQA